MNKLVTVLFALTAVALTGCGAASSPSDQEHEGTLEDGDSVISDDDSRYDDYTVEAEKDWTITIEMRSEAFQPYVWLFAPSGQALVQEAALGDGKVTIEHTASERGTYTVRANSVDGTGRGAYTIQVKAGPPEQPASN